MKLTLYGAAKVVGAKNTISEFDGAPLRQIESDSRKIEGGDLFLPLKSMYGGHDFIEAALESGAVATFPEREVTGHSYIWVDDCLRAFQALASYYPGKQRVDVTAMTGSDDRTTTKDMITVVSSTEYKTYKTQGNYNNEIGLPYIALHMPDDTEEIVLGVGQDHMGDIHPLSELAKPHIGVMTLTDEIHLEFFGSRGKVTGGKLQIVDGTDSDGTLIAPVDTIVDPCLPESQMVICFGDGAEIFVKDLQEGRGLLILTINVIDHPITLPVPGRYNATNAVIAVYIGKLLVISDSGIIEALETIELTRNHTGWKKIANGADILSDVYNANPMIMYLILETFSRIPANEGGKKIAMFADMEELGEQSVELYECMIMSLSPKTLDTPIFYGEDIVELAQLASQVFPTGKIYCFKRIADGDQFDTMLETIQEVLQPADQILLKGNSSMRLARVVEALEE